MIERRILLAALAATAAMPAFAQSGGGTQTSTDRAADNAPPASGAQAVGDAERKHMMDVMAVGAMSLAASRVAVKKAKDDDVKEFAQFEVAEQETMADIIKSMKEGRASGKVDAPSDAELRQHIAQQDQAMLQKMEQMQAGEEFDRAYVQAQTDGHQKLLRIQETYLSSGRDIAHLSIAKLARGQIKEHLALLADLDDDDSKTTGQSKRKK